jgi:16S rRNA (guanine527-N7)-methyltransferase
VPTLTESRIAELLEPYLQTGEGPPLALPEGALGQFGAYLDLLLHWNARTNLTAIREPEAIVARHFGESVFVARQLAGLVPVDGTLLDFGSGAGFPGLPIQIVMPALHVTLAESQGKKAAFLREAGRALALNAEVWAKRVEDMPPARTFDVVALRAVDRMEDALRAARIRVRAGGILAVLRGVEGAADDGTRLLSVPGGTQSVLALEVC